MRLTGLVTATISLCLLTACAQSLPSDSGAGLIKAPHALRNCASLAIIPTTAQTGKQVARLLAKVRRSEVRNYHCDKAQARFYERQIDRTVQP